MIVIEGMDNSGKSTLAQALALALNLTVQESEGPPLIEPLLDPTGEIEINERCDRYEDMGGRVLFVRHPVISNHIYGQIRLEGDPITPSRRQSFYENNPLLIYCDAGNRGLGAHVLKAHDSEKHITDITANYNKLLYLYRQWAAEHAHFIYRIGDDMAELIETINFRDAYRVA